jgi:hypothetical protein
MKINFFVIGGVCIVVYSALQSGSSDIHLIVRI